MILDIHIYIYSTFTLYFLSIKFLNCEYNIDFSLKQLLSPLLV